MLIFLLHLYCGFILFGCLLTVLFLWSVCLTGDFIVFDNSIFFSFTLFKLNPEFLKKCFFSIYFFFNNDIYSALWFNNKATILCTETFFFNSLLSSVHFLIMLGYAIIYPIIFFYFFKFRKSFILFISLQIIGFVLFSYVLYLFLNLYVRAPDLFFFEKALNGKSRVPNSYFPDIFWEVPVVDRTCVFCYADYPEITLKLVNDAYCYYSLLFPDCGKILCRAFQMHSRVIEVKQQVAELLFSQCPNYANDFLQDSVKALRKDFNKNFNLRLYFP